MTERKVSLHDLPRFSDKLSYLYVDHALIEQETAAISVTREDGSSVAVPTILDQTIRRPWDEARPELQEPET